MLTRNSALAFSVGLTLMMGAATFGAVQAQDHAPTLSDLQRLQVQVLVKDLEIAQLRAQAAQRDFDAAREKLTVLSQRLQVEGHTLNLDTLTYTKIPQ